MKKYQNIGHCFLTLIVSSNLFLMGCASRGNTPTITIEDFIRSRQSYFRLNTISEDGNLIYTVFRGQRIWQYNVNTKAEKIVYESKKMIKDLEIIPGLNRIFFVTESDGGKVKEFNLFSLELGAKRPTLMKTLSGKSFDFCGFDEDSQIFTYLFKNEHNSRVGIFKASISKQGQLEADPELIVDPEPFLSCGFFTKDQEHYVFSRYESISTTHLLSQNLKSKTQTKLIDKDGIKAYPDERFNLDSGLYFTGNYSSDTRQIYSISEAGNVTQKTFGSWDVTQFLYAKSKNSSFWITNEDGYSRLNFGDQNLKYLQKIELPFSKFSIYGLSKDDRYILLRASTSTADDELYRYNWENGELIQITGFNSKFIDQKVLIQAKTVRIKSVDGLEFSAVVYEPKSDVKNGVAIIDVHGGPQSQARPDYDMDVQFLLNNGFTIIQPNYRGSRGYGNKFERMIYRDWGGAHMLDIAATRNYLIEKLGVQKNKIAIMGSSFGGYTVGVAAVRTGNDFCAAIAGFGLFDLLTDIEQVPGWDNKSISEAIGSAVKDRERLKENSPLFAVDKIKVPMLIIYGELDQNVLKNQSEEFIKKLKSLNKPHLAIVFENEGHGLDSWSNIRLQLKDIAKFTLKNCGP